MKQEEIENYKKAGEISKKVKVYAREIIKKGEKLREIADKIEEKIIELGGQPAFPVNLSIDDIAAHHTPSSTDEETAKGLLKVDLGVHIKGCIADTAFSLDLENSEENKKLIQASDEALKKAIETTKPGIEIWKIGEIIQKTIETYNLSPIKNLSGHSLKEYIVHGGITIPNYNNNNENKLEKGAYAIEPFSTNGQGVIYEGKPSSIYRFDQILPIRDSFTREVFKYIQDNFDILPFCERWVVKKFGNRARLSLRQLEQTKILYQYPEFVEKAHGKVAQSEHTILITDKVEVTT